MRKYLPLMLVLLFCTAASAQVAPAPLRIGKGDVVSVQVFKEPELSLSSARVDDTGSVRLPLIGDVSIQGLTPSDAAKKIEDIYRAGLLVEPHVVVSTVDYVAQSVSVLGEVAKPGAVLVTSSRPVTAVVALAGGITPLADRNILVQRHDSGQILTYFLPNNISELEKPAVDILPGDTVIVPKAKLVYILGDVKLPGGYTMTTNDSRLSVLQLVARAAGTNPTAVPSHAKLIRKTSGGGYETVALPLGDMQKGKAPDRQLMPDDIVYVPFSLIRSIGISSVGSIPSSLAAAAVYRF